MTQLRVSHLSDARQSANAINSALRRTDAINLSADQTTVIFDRAVTVAGGASLSGDLGAVNAVLTGDLTTVNANASGVYKVGSIQVVGARQTGWAADTGTAETIAHATYTTTAISNPPTQAQVQAISDALQAATRGQKAVKDALIAHGLIGA